MFCKRELQWNGPPNKPDHTINGSGPSSENLTNQFEKIPTLKALRASAPKTEYQRMLRELRMVNLERKRAAPEPK